jgi:hypothetical protein
MSTGYDTLVDLLESIEHFLNHLDIYTEIPSRPALDNQVSSFSLTWYVTQCNAVKSVKKLLGEKVVEAVLQRLDRLTLDEARMTALQIFEVIYCLV